MKYYLKTYGCQMNISDTERVVSVLENMGWEDVSDPEKADMILFNTCSVRQKAEDRVVGLVKNYNKFKEKKPQLRIGITGCMVRKTGVRDDKGYQVDANLRSDDRLFKWIPGLDFVFRIEETPKLQNIVSSLYGNNEVEDFFNDYDSYFQIRPQYGTQAQAFVPIMQGCNNFCSYCIVPYSRGREKCRPLQEIVSEITDLAEKGCKEVTLLGQNVNSYKLDEAMVPDFQGERDMGKTDFVILLQEVNKIPGIKRIRYTSSHPKDFEDDLIEAHATLDNLSKHVHLAVQSGDDNVLKRMNRHYTAEEFLGKIQRLKKNVPGIAVTTDIIVGFCGETEEEYLHTKKLVEEIQFDTIYLAEYSPRSGTYAGDKLDDDVPHSDKERRWHDLNNLLRSIAFDRNQLLLGKVVEVLVEKEKNDIWIGKTECFKTVHFKKNHQNEDLMGKIVPVSINDAKMWILEGDSVQEKGNR